MPDEYTREIAKISDTHLGYEDHGILTAYLTMNYGGSTFQGAGGYDLRSGESAAIWISRTLNACGVDRWEKLKGRTIFVLFEAGSRMPIGIEPLPTETGKQFLFKEVVLS